MRNGLAHHVGRNVFSLFDFRRVDFTRLPVGEDLQTQQRPSLYLY